MTTEQPTDRAWRLREHRRALLDHLVEGLVERELRRHRACRRRRLAWTYTTRGLFGLAWFVVGFALCYVLATNGAFG